MSTKIKILIFNILPFYVCMCVVGKDGGNGTPMWRVGENYWMNCHQQLTMGGPGSSVWDTLL